MLAEWSAGTLGQAGDVSVNEGLLAFWRHAEEHYRHPDGKPTSELANFRYALEPVKELYGHVRAADFDSLTLDTVRAEMVNAGHCRTRVNRDVQRIKHAFRWAAKKRLVPVAVHQLLDTVEGLRRGRTTAHETEPIKPVAEEVVNAALPFLRPQTAAMVRLQLLTGMRPGEVVIMRKMDLDRTAKSKVWIYRPKRHKTEYRGHDRVILIGPRGQELLTPWLLRSDESSLFVRAEDGQWSSASAWHESRPVLDPGPVPRPARRRAYVSRPQTEAEVERLRECLQRRRPYGDAAWTVKTARRTDLEAGLRPRGRPRKNLGPESSLFGEEESDV